MAREICKVFKSREDPGLLPPAPENWEYVIKKQYHDDPGCIKDEWTEPDKCNLVVRRIYLKHKTENFTQRLRVVWYDQCEEMCEMGYLTREVQRDLVTGDIKVRQWNDNAINWNSAPFKGRLQQLNNGEWRKLLPDEGWTILAEFIKGCDNTLNIYTAYTNQYRCCEFDIKNINTCGIDPSKLHPYSREGCEKCDGVCYLNTIPYFENTNSYETTCTKVQLEKAKGIELNTSNCCSKK
jgi:hypothetical protein